MNKNAVVKSITSLLNNSSAKKKVILPDYNINISDNFGNQHTLHYPPCSTFEAYTEKDVEVILSAFLWLLQDSLRKGETVSIHGWFSLGLKYRLPRSTKSIQTGAPIIIDGHYVPNFKFGERLREPALNYETLHSVNDESNIKLGKISEEIDFEEFYQQLTGESLDEIGDDAE